ncbi:MAG: phosphotransferase [Acidimicrobiales bacterium]
MATDLLALVEPLVTEAFPSVTIERVTEVGRGRGVFSLVAQVEFGGVTGAGPCSVVVKVPAPGPNGEAAIAAGACTREALAYRELLPASPVRAPRCFLVRTDGDAASFVLEDLCGLRSVDQLEGLDRGDAMAVVTTLADLHRHWADRPSLTSLPVRRSTPSGFSDEVLTAGLDALATRWEHAIGSEVREAFENLVADRQRLVDAFAAAGPPTLCHGDPRADNLAFEADGAPVLYDWQQLAIQFGPADLAWLSATSLEPTHRRAAERDLVAAYGTTMDHYRLGLVLPGLAVLFLAQREATSDRAGDLIATSIVRIGTAIADLEVSSAG